MTIKSWNEYRGLLHKVLRIKIQRIENLVDLRRLINRKIWQMLGIFSLLITAAACSVTPKLSATPTISQNSNKGPGAQPSPTFTTVTRFKKITPDQAVTTAVTPTTGVLNFENPQITIRAKGLANPDDLVLGMDQAIYLSDLSKGSVEKLTGNGSVQVIISGLTTPEGIIYLPGGTLIIAEQGRNRLLKFDPATQSLSTFLNLANTTNQEGVDGLALDATNPNQESIIIPDSPNGVLRRASLIGAGSTTVIASGFGRPTGAWVELDGSILVVDESTGYLYRVHPDGTKVQLARFSTPDDVIEDDAGNIYINTLGDHAVHVHTAKGQDIVLLHNIIDPQGITFTKDGNLLVTDPVNHQLIEILIHNQS
jgi:sugar lactone lactonase YvrE